MHEVFVSHSAKDSRAAGIACAALEREGIRCFMAPRDVPPGKPWAEALVAAIQSSRLMLLILSPETNTSEHVVREVSAAADARIPILPLRVESTVPTRELGYYIQRAHWLDAIEPPLERHMGALCDAVRGILPGGPTGGPQEPPVAVGGPVRAGRTPRRFEMRKLGAMALLAALVVGLVVALFVWPRSPATLSLDFVPTGSQAIVDGTLAGTTPLVLPVEAGRHSLLLRHRGFKDWSGIVDLAPGQLASYSHQLILEDTHDTTSMNVLAKPLGLALSLFALPKGQRGAGDGAPVELIVPRGPVRPADLTKLVFDVDGERVSPTGRLALLRGEVTLWSIAYEPRGGLNEVPLPPEVSAGLRADDTLTWGWWSKDTPPVTLTIGVVADEVAPLLARIDERLAEQPPGLRAHLRAQALLDRDLATGAYLEASALLRADPRDLRAGAVMEQALSRSGAAETRVAESLRGDLRSAPPEERARVFAPVPETSAPK